MKKTDRIKQLKAECAECNRDNIALTAENNALRASDAAKARRIADLIGEAQELRDKIAHMRLSVDSSQGQAWIIRIAMAEEVAKAKNENTRLSAALLEATAQRRNLSERHDRDQLLIDGLTLLADKFERRAIEAESDSRTMEPG